jgi:thiol-disulfide isomerase/thioredoxin
MMQTPKGERFEEFKLDMEDENPFLSSNNSYYNSTSEEDSDSHSPRQHNTRPSSSSSPQVDSTTNSEEEAESCLTGLEGPSKQKFKCRFNHQFPASFDFSRVKWCPKCDDLLKKCQQFADENGGECTNERYEEHIHFTCQKGHSWKLNHKNARKRWCLDCQKQQKAEMKKKCEQERAQRQKEEEEYQKRLFDEAKQKVMNDQFSSLPQWGGNCSNNNTKNNNAKGHHHNHDKQQQQ